MLCQEKSTPFRKVRRLEPKRGEKGWIEPCRASSAAADPPFELLLGLLLQPQLAGQLSCRRQTHRNTEQGRSITSMPTDPQRLRKKYSNNDNSNLLLSDSLRAHEQASSGACPPPFPSRGSPYSRDFPVPSAPSLPFPTSPPSSTGPLRACTYLGAG